MHSLADNDGCVLRQVPAEAADEVINPAYATVPGTSFQVLVNDFGQLARSSRLI